jgi:anti-sigma factor RsiW
MTQVTFDERACRKTRAKLDSFIDDELLVETYLEIARHFQNCGGCAREAAERRELRGRLRAAARAVPTPTGLDERVRARLRQDGRPGKTQWSLMAIAAAVVLSFGSYAHGVLRIAVDRPMAPALRGVLEIKGNHPPKRAIKKWPHDSRRALAGGPPVVGGGAAPQGSAERE